MDVHEVVRDINTILNVEKDPVGVGAWVRPTHVWEHVPLSYSERTGTLISLLLPKLSWDISDDAPSVV